MFAERKVTPPYKWENGWRRAEREKRAKGERSGRFILHRRVNSRLPLFAFSFSGRAVSGTALNDHRPLQLNEYQKTAAERRPAAAGRLFGRAN